MLVAMKVNEGIESPQITHLLLKKKCSPNCHIKITLEEGNRVRGYKKTADSFESISFKGLPHFLAKEDVSKAQKLLEDSFFHLHTNHIEVFPRGSGGMMNPPERRVVSDALAILQINDPTESTLDLREKEINARELQLLANALATNTSIQILHLSHNPIGKGPKKVKESSMFGAMRAARNAYREQKQSKSKKQSPCPSSKGCKKGLEGILALSKALIWNQTLRELHLSKSQISGTGLILLFEALAVNRSLCVLDVSYNKLSDRVGETLAEMLKTNNVLTWVNISSNNHYFEDGGALKALALAFKNTSLQHLVYEQGQLQGRCIPPRKYEQWIQFYLDRNRELAEARMRSSQAGIF